MYFDENYQRGIFRFWRFYLLELLRSTSQSRSHNNPGKMDKTGWRAKRLGRKHEDRKPRNQPILGSGWRVSDNEVENKGFRKPKPGAPLEEHHRYVN
jgi:hypothetical protein